MLYAFDIDGTLVRSFMREGDAEHDYDDIELLPGRLEAVRRLAWEDGACFALVTNQAGVAMGYQSAAQVREKVGRVLAAFEFFGGKPVSVHICMHHPKAKVVEWQQDPCPRRKPAPGMLLEARAVHGIEGYSEMVFVGDMASDSEAATAAGVRYVDAAAFFG